jgi:uncharacterized protein involved in exopolysaccharide biosynthesis
MFEPVSDRKPGERGSLFDVDEDVGTLPEGAGRDDLVIVEDVRPGNQPTRRERRAVAHEARGSLLDPAAIVDSLWRWKFLIAATSVAGAVVGVMIALATPHDYGATARLYIDPRDIRSSDTDSSSSQLLPTDAMLAVVDSQVEILSSNNVLQTVVDDLGLVNDPEMNGSVRPAGLGALIAPLTRLFAEQGEEPSARLVLANLRDAVSVSRDPRTFIVNVSATSRDPEKSARIANSIVENYMSTEAMARSGLMERTSQALSGRIEELRQDLDTAERAVEQFKADNGIIGASGEVIGENQLLAFAERLTQAQTERVQLAARADTVRSFEVDDVLSGALPEEVASDTMTGLRAEYASLRAQSDSLATRLGPRHPQLIALQSSLAAVRDEIRNELRRIGATADTELRRAVETEGQLSAQLNILKTQQLNTNVDGVALRELERKAAATRQIYEDFLLRARRASEQQNITIGNVRVIADAEPPLEPSGPSRKVIAIGGLIFGLVTGLGLAGLAGVAQSVTGRPLSLRAPVRRHKSEEPKPAAGPQPVHADGEASARPGFFSSRLSNLFARPRTRRSPAQTAAVAVEGTGATSPSKKDQAEGPRRPSAPAPVSLADYVEQSAGPEPDRPQSPSFPARPLRATTADDDEIEQLRERMRILRQRAETYARMGS